MIHTIILAGLPQDIANAILKAFGAALAGFLNSLNVAQTLLSPLQPLFTVLIRTDPQLTYQNQAVIGTWRTMVIVADALLVLMLMSGGVQMMVGRATGIIYVPPSELLGKFFAVGLAMNFSLLWGQVLIDINNGLTSFTQFDLGGFINTVTTGAAPSQRTIVLLFVSTIFSLTFIFLIFTAVTRIVLINLLLVLSPLWTMLWLLPQTEEYAAFGSRLLAVTIFTQFIQILAFTLGAKFIVSSGMGDAVGKLIMGTGVMFLIATIPRLLTRIGGGSHAGGGGGLGGVMRAAVVLRAFL